jgi:glycosyltransferase involved in cell wall biosynthesis
MLSVSVVMPTYNCVGYLEQAVASVHAQTRSVAELVIVDDCSTDGTPDLARRLGARVLSNPVNSGPSIARNNGIEAATGDLVAFLDADDTWEPDHLEIIAGLVEGAPEVVLGFSRVRAIGAERYETTAELPDGQAADARWQLLGRNIIPQITVVARRAALVQAGLYDTSMRYAEDYELWTRLAELGPFVCSHRITANYRVHAAQATGNRVALYRGAWTVRRRLLESFTARGDAERAREVLHAMWRRELRWAWHECDRPLADEILRVAEWLPSAAEERARWERRAQFGWPLWVQAKRGLARLKRTVGTGDARR